MTNTTLNQKIYYSKALLREIKQNTHLAQCETKKKQKWHFASRERAKLLAKYFPEFILYLL